MRNKVICIFLLVIIICVSGCSSYQSGETFSNKASDEKATLTLFIDGGDYLEADVKKALKDIPEYGNQFDVDITYVAPNLDNQKEAREGALQNATLDLVSGGGADVYICACTSGFDLQLMKKGTFTYPESAMRLGYFLPLDNYIENAHFMDWDNMFPQVMAAGKNQEEQLLIPLTFKIFTSLYDKEKYERPDSLPITYQEQYENEDPGIRIASRGATDSFGTALGALADYKSDKLNFSKADLQQYVESTLSCELVEDMEFRESIGFIEPGVLIEPDQTVRFPDKQSGGKQQDYVMIPTYNRTGGVTAYITSYAAVNRNTKYPEYAFSIVDRLAGKDMQQKFMFGRGMPVHMELGKKDGSLGETNWFLTDWNYEQYQWICSQVNEVEFCTELNVIMCQLISDCYAEADVKRREELVSKAYSQMEMIVGEV